MSRQRALGPDPATRRKPVQPLRHDCAPCPGWAIFDEGTDREAIQRCDTCKKFETDDEAAVFAVKSLKAVILRARDVFDPTKDPEVREIIVAWKALEAAAADRPIPVLA